MCADGCRTFATSFRPDFSLSMRPLNLYTKTTLLASAITLAVLGVVLSLTSVRFAERVREGQKELAQLQADRLADHISQMPAPRDPAEIARIATLVRGGRPLGDGPRISRGRDRQARARLQPNAHALAFDDRRARRAESDTRTACRRGDLGACRAQRAARRDEPRTLSDNAPTDGTRTPR